MLLHWYYTQSGMWGFSVSVQSNLCGVFFLLYRICFWLYFAQFQFTAVLWQTIQQISQIKQTWRTEGAKMIACLCKRNRICEIGMRKSVCFKWTINQHYILVKKYVWPLTVSSFFCTEYAFDYILHNFKLLLSFDKPFNK